MPAVKKILSVGFVVVFGGFVSLSAGLADHHELDAPAPDQYYEDRYPQQQKPKTNPKTPYATEVDPYYYYEDDTQDLDKETRQPLSAEEYKPATPKKPDEETERYYDDDYY